MENITFDYFPILIDIFQEYEVNLEVKILKRFEKVSQPFTSLKLNIIQS